MVLTLKCKARCTKIHKKSQSPAFKGMLTGDIIEFSTGIERHRSLSSSASYIDCYNPRTNEYSNLSLSQLSNILKNFEFEEVIHDAETSNII